jgi:hypothetical protein
LYVEAVASCEHLVNVHPRAATRWMRRGGSVAVVVAVVTLCASPVFGEPAFFATHVLPNDVGSLVPGAQPYSAVSCASPGNCLVAGPLDTGAGDTDATVLQEASGTWGSPTQLVLPANADTPPDVNEQSLNDVSCWSSGNCATVGDYIVNTNFQSFPSPVPEPMVDTEADSVWATPTEMTISNPDLLIDGSATVVSCDSSGDCTAAGFLIETSDTDVETAAVFVTTEAAASGTWLAPTLLTTSIPDTDIVIPTALTCLDATDCTMSDEVISGSNASSYLQSEVSGTWGNATSVPKVGSRPFAINDLTCTASGACVAVGFTSPTAADLANEADTLPAVATETASVWSSPKDLALPVLSPSTDQGLLSGISCFAQGQCEAVGDASIAPTNNFNVGIAVSLSGTTWSTIGIDPVAARAGKVLATSSELLSDACVTATTCTVIGVAQSGSASQTVDAYGYLTTVGMSEPLSVPGKPSGVKVISTTAHAKITFNAPTTDGGARITLFTVTATSANEHTKSCVTPGLSCTISGLVKGHVYQVTVVAKNSKGVSKPSKVVSFKAA